MFVNVPGKIKYFLFLPRFAQYVPVSPISISFDPTLRINLSSKSRRAPWVKLPRKIMKGLETKQWQKNWVLGNDFKLNQHAKVGISLTPSLWLLPRPLLCTARAEKGLWRHKCPAEASFPWAVLQGGSHFPWAPWSVRGHTLFWSSTGAWDPRKRPLKTAINEGAPFPNAHLSDPECGNRWLANKSSPPKYTQKPCVVPCFELLF